MNGGQHADYGRGEHTIDVESDPMWVDSTEVSALVRDAFANPDYHPPMLPASALEVHRLSSLPNVRIPDVVRVLELDPMLASDALRVAQSPMFRGPVPPASLRDAVMRMGLNNIRDLAFGVAFQSQVFRAPGYDDVMDRVRKHGMASGHVARMIAKGSAFAEYAFLCGLLHNVGMAAILLVLANEKRKVVPEVLALVLA